MYLAHLCCASDCGSHLAVDSVRQARPLFFSSPSPLPLFFLLLDEAEGAIRGDQALQSSKLQFLSPRASLYMGEYVQLIKIEK